MGCVRLASLAALSMLVCSSVSGQAQSLSISNYQFVNEQTLTQTKSSVTYRADLVNTGTASAAVTATVTSLDPFSVRVVPGQDGLLFAPVPANSQVTSSNTFTILIDHTFPFDFSKLQWAFQITAGGPFANAGPNRTAAVGSLVTLNGSGSTNPSGVGTLTYSWAFTSRPPGSTAFLLRSETVMPAFVVDVPGNYIITLTVGNGVASGSSSVTVSTLNTPPVANAGPNQTVAVGSTAVLNGSGSTSMDGRLLTYAWTLIARPADSAATLTGANTVSPAFLVDKSGTYVAQLIVNDGLTSSPSTVTITVQITPPVANAGPGQVVSAGALAQLNGSGSTDANGLPLTYQWSLISLPPGSTATLSAPTAVNPTFTADRSGTYVAQLIVNNGTLNSAPATVTITTQAQLAPTANAGPNQTVNVGSTATLNGSGTDAYNLPLSFQWSLISKPAGSAAGLSSTVIANPAFVADLAGTYVVQLIVNNGVLSSAPSTVSISTACAQPVANPGPNQNVLVGAMVTLDGSGSGDVCHGPLTYAWAFTTRPAGSAATLAGATTVSPTFVGDLAGIYVVQLIVNNGFTNSNPATVTITTSAGPGMAAINLPVNMTVAPGQSAPFPVTLGTASPPGGVFLTLSSSDTSKVTVAPVNIFIPQGATASSRAPAVSGISAGSATITASVYGWAPASQLVQVTSGATLSFSPGSLTINGTATQNLTLILSAPAPAGGLTVSLSSSNTGVATAPAAVSFGANTTSVAVPVTGVAAGSATITANGPGIPSAAASVTVSGTAPQPAAINLPANVTVAPGQSAPFPVTLTAPAPTGGVTVMLSSSDTSKVIVTPSVFIVGGATSPAPQPQVNSINPGSATIWASAPGYTPGTGRVQVVTGGGSSSFSPGSLTIQGTATLILTLVLSTPAPAGGLTVNLSSSNTGVATVPATVSIWESATSATVPVTGIAAGSATITASTPNFGNAAADVTVSSLQGVSVTWHGACWQPATIYGITGNFQGIDFVITTPAPVPVQGTLFFAPNCDPRLGTDNMNDYNALTGSMHMVQGFTHYPDTIPSSAIYWVGNRTADGMCPPGSPCSGCVNYTKTTPDCSTMP